jgi:hypothetical protein
MHKMNEYRSTSAIFFGGLRYICVYQFYDVVIWDSKDGLITSLVCNVLVFEHKKDYGTNALSNGCLSS